MTKAQMLAAGTAFALLAGPAGAATETACRPVAAAIRAMPAPPNLDKESDLTDHPLQRLAARPRPPLQLDQSQPLPHDQIATLAQQAGAGSAAVSKAVSDLDLTSVDAVWLRKAGDTGVSAVETQAGTLDCSAFVFYLSAAGRPATLIPAPPQLAATQGSDDAGGFCGTDEGLIGAVAGAPLFAESGWDSIEPSDLISLTTWRGGRWTDPCRIDVRYRRVYAAGEAFCNGAACEAMTRAAVAMATRREAQITAHGGDGHAPAAFAWGPGAAAADRAKVAKLKELIGSANGQALPTLGEGDPPVHAYGEDAVMFPARIAGKTYLAILSHGSIGWRVFPDYVLGLYDLRAGQAAPVAGFHIERTVIGPARVTIGRWRGSPKVRS